MTESVWNHRAVAKILKVSVETVIKDINKAIRELCVLLTGLPAVPDNPKNETEALKSLFNNFQLLKCCQKIACINMGQQLEYEHIQGLKLTNSAFRCMEKIMLLYEDYCNCCITQKTASARSLEVIKALYMDNSIYRIPEIAEQQQVSRETIYIDVRTAIRHMAEIMKYMAENVKDNFSDACR